MHAFTFRCKDSRSDAGSGEVVINAENLMECRMLLKQHLVQLNRSDLFGAFRFSGMKLVERGIAYTNIEKGEDPFLILSEFDASQINPCAAPDILAAGQVDPNSKRGAVTIATIKPSGEPARLMTVTSQGIEPSFNKKFIRPPYLAPKTGGLYNQFGREIPNPCSEIDLSGRNMDKIWRWAKPDDNLMDEATLDRLNAIVETPQLMQERLERLHKMMQSKVRALETYGHEGETLEDVVDRVIKALPSDNS